MSVNRYDSLVRKPFSKNCGWCRIRTCGALTSTVDFKSTAFDLSANHPLSILLYACVDDFTAGVCEECGEFDRNQMR